jgi:hypothetical protein
MHRIESTFVSRTEHPRTTARELPSNPALSDAINTHYFATRWTSNLVSKEKAADYVINAMNEYLGKVWRVP